MGDNSTDEALKFLNSKGKVPFKNYPKNNTFKRWQSTPQSSGVYYGKPTPESMGRFNDPTGNTGICYVAEHAVTAIAESYGRNYQKEKKKGFSYRVSRDSLDEAHVCTLQAERELVTVDLCKLQAKLHITTDQLSSDEYGLTQEIVAYFANEPKASFDGISYRSRHMDHGYCVALFERDKESLRTVAMAPMSEYKDSEYLPSGWKEPDIDGEEILTEVLDIDVF
ncbi:RES domain-containing protein [Vibrio crassostreae]|uniref:RES family NAD+ phosphorylase n=1 Tax=Vibrio splendidus TaxID=29497 RepID=A0AB35N5U9_VIBSP|nr:MULTISPECIES: RES family NAD+ phosphorylase [Vibrio]MDP2503978.1 RES family NAD+ phosphorylase [Vibrio splendidus]CAK1691359.1 RES domain-containing protein [Vibrio crassostreae]CAK1692984.1 RES domain-containing protein [Vibrio crassostreae]CAK1693483.1 RES domain-containing protein [Vibrio crassostreae]CAK1710740.1 RES domain-containing protein [Vibrio crassostreae]